MINPLDKFVKHLDPQSRDRLLRLFELAKSETDPVARQVACEKVVTMIREKMRQGPNMARN